MFKYFCRKLFTKLFLMEIQVIKFQNFSDLINIINFELGDFTDVFRYRRKELANLNKTSKRGILFKYENSHRNWAINEGAGTEVQYHLYYHEEQQLIYFGLGFNTRYVPFKNDKTPLEYIQPYVDAYLQLANSKIVKQIKNKGFEYEGEDEDLNNLEEGCHYLIGRKINAVNNSISSQDFNSMIEDIKSDLFDLYCAIFEKRNQLIDKNNIYMDYIELLENNKNLIFTGAPGTGKTYLAKQIAREMIGLEDGEELEDKKQYGFVQFHPSYDYTDFVEGLRPIKKDNQKEIGFELKDGIFKEFCENVEITRANLLNDITSTEELKKEYLEYILNTEHVYKNYIRNLLYDEDIKTDNEEYKLLPSNNSIRFKIPFVLKIETYGNSAVDFNYIHNTSCVEKIINNNDQDFYSNWREILYYCIDNYNKEVFHKWLFDNGKIKPQKYVFIIDEINRAEISKVFGELFFSIDPGYRGKKGTVKTQYHNLVESRDDNYVFKKGFFIPENVYIIGTMNDIDRSVESMDFAMRRRFAWQEITAEDSFVILDQIEDEEIRVKAKNRLTNLNNAINLIDGLNSSYHIGASYFLKLKNYNNDFSKLWNNHLKGVLFEYLRGFPDTGTKLGGLKKAYNNEEISDVQNNG